MSSAYSQVETYQPYIPTTDINLVNTVLATKQQKYDTNVAQIDELLGQFGNIDLIREEDKQYLSEKLKTLVDNVNSYGKLKVGNNDVTRGIKNYIKTALDDRVVTQIANTAKIRNYQSEVAQVKEKNRDAYSDINYAFGLQEAGYQDYLAGNTDSIGNLTYRDYTDVGKELKDISENLDQFADVIKEVTPEGIYFKTIEGKRLSKDKVRSIAEMQMSDAAKRQMEINGWANFETKMSPDDLVTSFTQLKDRRLQSIDGNIADLQVKLRNAVGNDQKEAITQQLNTYKNYRKSQQDSYDSYLNSGNTRGMAFTLEKETTMDSFANVFAFNNVGTSYSTNTAALQEARLAAKTYKDATGRTTQTGLPELEQVSVPTQLESVDIYGNLETKASEYDTAYKNSVSQLYERQDAQTKSAIESYLKTNNISEADREDAVFDYLQGLAEENSSVVSIGDIEAVNSLRANAEKFYNRYNEVNNRAVSQLEEQALTSIYTTAINNEGIKIVNDQGNAVSLKQYLQSKGVRNVEDLQNNDKIKNDVLKQYYADMFYSSNTYGVGALNTSDTQKLYLERLSNLFGESGEVQIEPIRSQFRESTPELEDLGYETGYTTGYRINPETSKARKTAEYLDRVRKAGAYDTNKTMDLFFGAGWINPDNSFEDAAATRNLMTRDKIRTAASNILGEDETLSRDLAIRVNPDSDLFTSLSNAVEDNLATEGSGFEVKKDNPLTVLEVNKDYVVVSQTRNPTEKDPATSRTARILKLNLPEHIRGSINFNSQENTYTSENFPDVETNVKYGSVNNIRRIRDLANNVLSGDITTAYSTTKEEVLGSFFQQYPQVLGSYENPSEDGAMLRRVVESNNLFLKTEKIDGLVYPKIVYRDNTGVEKDIFTPSEPFSDDQLNSSYKVMKYAPQLYVNQMLNNMIIQRATGTYSNYYNELKNIYGRTTN